MIDEVVQDTAKSRTQINYQALCRRKEFRQLRRIPCLNNHSAKAQRYCFRWKNVHFFGSLLSYFVSHSSGFESGSFDTFSRSVLSRPRIHLALFVIRVNGLLPGCYVLVRYPQKLQSVEIGNECAL
jgi:hypothetical protein